MIENISKLLQIDKKEVLRYLQYKNQNLSNNINEEIDNCINRTREIINPRYVFRTYFIEKQDINNKKIVYLKDSNIKFESEDIYRLFDKCDECILISSTLGLEIEKEIRKLTYTNLSKGLIIDACATTAIEEVCDILQENIERELLKENKHITMRYSPGYGDLSIEKNVDIINILNSQKEIGLTVTDSGIMIPRKSVVALIGVSKKGIKREKKSCDNCSNKHNCKYKKEAKICGD
ncbi:vitamin B12 dependent-methionine synthase activation domain-containing protein [Terrisporobacter sp.]|uniref:vitamin B12 dependent-methionine synthase activation domain-containing protein n=1 Tax=Terrisporobacter sp. TaxID=1965305 RepID=UPI0026028B80|nr:vitamin B12 dependent-methionine synthase activation domain-containing protein [Terrisporobacter sp.]